MNPNTQTCPACGAAISSRAKACQCGQILDRASLSSAAAGTQTDTEYETYLFARLDQARLAAERAIALLNQNPDDPTRLRAAEQATEQLSHLNRKVDRLKPGKTSEHKALDQRVHRQQRARRQALDEANERRMAYRKAAQGNQNHLISGPKPVHSVSLDGSHEALRQQELDRSGAGRVRLPTSAAIDARRADQKRIADRAMALANRRNGQATMPDQLRAEHAEKASEALRRVRQSTHAISDDLAAASMALAAGRKECPNCTAQVDRQASECRCGYSFTRATDAMPGLATGSKSKSSDSPITVFEKPRFHRR